MDMILDEYKTTYQLSIKTEGQWDRETGVFVEGEEILEENIGAILPLSQDDFVKNQDGTYTRDDKKLYTSKDIINGQTVKWNGYDYKVNSDLDYSYIDPDFKRYFLKRVGATSD